MLNILVNQVLSNKEHLLGLEDVIEKEILHHDIMTVLHRAGILQRLTFIGGTSLRLCYNSSRLSEDLDFTAGLDFEPKEFAGLGDELQNYLVNKYGLSVTVREPKLTNTDTSTWKITIEKHNNRPDLPSQKMHIDVCSLPSFDILNRPIMDHYGINSPMAGLPIPVQSMQEILADKMIAFAYRERRIKPRDVWDIVWLKQQGVNQMPELVLKKLDVRKKPLEDFNEKISKHALLVENDTDTKINFHNEMKRFLPQDLTKRTIEQSVFWDYLTNVIKDEVRYLQQELQGPSQSTNFNMKM